MRAKEKLRSRLLGSLLLAATLVGLSPVLAYGQAPVARVVLYEVAEALTFKPHSATSPEELTRRLATATLLSKDVVPLSTPVTPPFTAGSFVVIQASSKVSLATETGPIRGTASILTDADPSRNSLDTLVVTATVSLRGDLDLTTATSGFAGVSGRWQVKGQDLSGTFLGTFLIPFQVSGLPGYWYINSGAGACATTSTVFRSICSVTPEEMLLGIPLTKAVFVLSR